MYFPIHQLFPSTCYREYYCQSHNLQQTGISAIVLTLYKEGVSTKKKKEKKDFLRLLQSKRVHVFFQIADNGLELSEMLGHLVSFFSNVRC